MWMRMLNCTFVVCVWRVIRWNLMICYGNGESKIKNLHPQLQGFDPGERQAARNRDGIHSSRKWKGHFLSTFLRRLKTPPPVLYPVKWNSSVYSTPFTWIFRNCVLRVWPGFSISEDLWIESSTWSKQFRWWFPKGLCLLHGTGRKDRFMTLHRVQVYQIL